MRRLDVTPSTLERSGHAVLPILLGSKISAISKSNPPTGRTRWLASPLVCSLGWSRREGTRGQKMYGGLPIGYSWFANRDRGFCLLVGGRVW